MMAQRVVTSLAILNVNYSSNSDYIDLFLPFIEECFRAAEHEYVATQVLQTAVYEMFGLHIPQNALKTILGRAKRKGLLTLEHGVYRIVTNPEQAGKFSKTVAELNREQTALMGKLVQYCQERHSTSWTLDTAEKNFLSYLEDHAIPVLAAAVDGLPVAPPTGVERGANYKIYSFVLHLYESDPAGFEFLTKIVKGRMLADVLLFPDVNTVKQQFDNVEMYLDTPVALRVLGYLGEGFASPCIEMISLFRSLNCRLCIFTHNLRELQGVLDAAERELRSPSKRQHGMFDVMEQFRAKGYTPGDVAQLRSSLEISLRNLNITVKDTPPYSESLGIDEVKLGTLLQTEVKYRRLEARDVDLASLTAIYRLRNGRTSLKLESSRAIFVTTNDPLARATTRFFKDEYRDTTGTYCMLDHVLSTLCWLKSSQPSPDLPQKRIIANCYAAMNPSDAVWEDYLGKIADLESNKEITAEDYTLLRYDTSVKGSLMEITQGERRPFTEGSIQTILEHARSEARRTTEAELEKVISAHREVQNALLRETTINSSGTLVLNETNARLLDAESRAVVAENIINTQRRNAKKTANKWALLFSVFIGLLLLSSVLLEILHGLPSTSHRVHSLFEGSRQWIFHTLLGIAALAYGLHAVRGYSIIEIVHKLRSRISWRIEQFILRRQGIVVQERSADASIDLVKL
jgi:hypothetical protein